VPVAVILDSRTALWGAAALALAAAAPTRAELQAGG
jgi:hypothetical protein